jgi:hypothetical protein
MAWRGCGTVLHYVARRGIARHAGMLGSALGATPRSTPGATPSGGGGVSRPLEDVLEQVVFHYMAVSDAHATCKIKLAGLDVFPEVGWVRRSGRGVCMHVYARRVRVSIRAVCVSVCLLCVSA